MNSQKLFENLPTLYNAAYSRDLWQEALDVFSDITDAKGVMLYAQSDQEVFSYSVSSSNSFFTGKEAIIREYSRKFINYDLEGAAAVNVAPSFSAVYDRDIWPDAERLRNREDIEFGVERWGVFRRVIFNLSERKYLTSGLILQYDKKHEDIPSIDVKKAAILVPHLAKALDINRFNSPLRLKYNAVLAVLDKIELGICIASPSGELIIVNSRAREILDDTDGIWLAKDNRLVCRNPDTTDQIREAIKMASSTANGEEDTASTNIVINQKSTVEPLLAIAAPLRDADRELGGDFGGCLLTLVDPNRASHANVEAFCKIYGITPAEAEVAKCIVQGYSTAEIAEIRNVVPSTVANQVKRILTKTSSGRRVELIWKIFQYSPPVC